MTAHLWEPDLPLHPASRLPSAERARGEGLSGTPVPVQGGNNGCLNVRPGEMVRFYGGSESTWQRAFGELSVAGYLATTRRGEWHGRRATEYRITGLRDDRRGVNDPMPTSDWQRIEMDPSLRKNPLPAVKQKPRRSGADVSAGVGRIAGAS